MSVKQDKFPVSPYAHAFRHSVKSSYFVVMAILFSLIHVILFPRSHNGGSVPAPGLAWCLLARALQNLHGQRNCPEDIQEEAPHPWGISILSSPGPGQ